MSARPFPEADDIPVDEPDAVVSYSPIVIEVPDRPVPLEIKVSMPASGSALPVILLSHGHGATNFLSSLHGLRPVGRLLGCPRLRGDPADPSELPRLRTARQRPPRRALVLVQPGWRI